MCFYALDVCNAVDGCSNRQNNKIFIRKKTAEFAIILELNDYSDCLKIG